MVIGRLTEIEPCQLLQLCCVISTTMHSLQLFREKIGGDGWYKVPPSDPRAPPCVARSAGAVVTPLYETFRTIFTFTLDDRVLFRSGGGVTAVSVPRRLSLHLQQQQRRRVSDAYVIRDVMCQRLAPALAFPPLPRRRLHLRSRFRLSENLLCSTKISDQKLKKK